MSLSASRCDVVICGAGAIGLSIARAASSCMKNLNVVVIDKLSHPGLGTTSRNSGVIHAGLYYHKDSLKRKFCASGKYKLLDYLKERGLPFNNCGKLVVATSTAEVQALSLLHKRAVANSVPGLELLCREEVQAIEPSVSCLQAMLVPETSILDVPSYISSLHNDCEANNVTFVFNCTFLSARKSKNEGGRFLVETDQGSLITKYLINCAGLEAPCVSRNISDYPAELIPKMYFAKGNYFKLTGSQKPFNRLIYPLPSEVGLGIHATLDMAGGTRFGPDVEWLRADQDPTDPYRFFTVPNEPGTYRVQEGQSESFYNEIRKYYPDLTDDDIAPDYAGLRPKIRGPYWSINGLNDQHNTRDLNDFIIEDAKYHGVAGLINLFGIESPGITCSLSIGEFVARNFLLSSF